MWSNSFVFLVIVILYMGFKVIMVDVSELLFVIVGSVEKLFVICDSFLRGMCEYVWFILFFVWGWIKLLSVFIEIFVFLGLYFLFVLVFGLKV